MTGIRHELIPPIDATQHNQLPMALCTEAAIRPGVGWAGGSGDMGLRTDCCQEVRGRAIVPVLSA